jgi:hypothetical protein
MREHMAVKFYLVAIFLLFDIKWRSSTPGRWRCGSSGGSR